LRSAENFQLVKALAEVLGGNMAVRGPSSRKAGWHRTGRLDRPAKQSGRSSILRLEYPCNSTPGGVEGADMIVAINTDPNAPIFDFAHLGIVADAIRFLPALTEAFRKHLSVNRLAG